MWWGGAQISQKPEIRTQKSGGESRRDSFFSFNLWLFLIRDFFSFNPWFLICGYFFLLIRILFFF